MRLEQIDVMTAKDYLYEGLDNYNLNHALLWESVGYTIKEAKLTPDQIEKLFKELENQANKSGDNRTLLGKGKDKAGELNAAWKDLKTKIYNSGPMTGFAAAYDRAAEKIGQENPQTMSYIKKYREFAEKHPIMQKAVYAALIAATGLSGAGLAGAAGLGLFKLVDQMLQGKDIRDALYAAGKTGATAAAVGGLKSFLHHTPDTSAHHTGVTRGATTDPYGIHAESAKSHAQGQIMNNFADKMGLPAGNHNAEFVGGGPVSIDGQPVPQDLYTPDQIANINAAKSMAKQMQQGTNESVRILDVAEMSILFETIQYLDEGLWDTIKKGAKAVAGSRVGQAVAATAKDAASNVSDYAKVKGDNLTNKITADKLMTAWKQASSPTDSEEVKKLLLAQGVDPKIITTAYKSMKPVVRVKAGTSATGGGADSNTSKNSGNSNPLLKANPNNVIDQKKPSNKTSKNAATSASVVSPKSPVKDVKSPQATVPRAGQATPVVTPPSEPSKSTNTASSASIPRQMKKTSIPKVGKVKDPLAVDLGNPAANNILQKASNAVATAGDDKNAQMAILKKMLAQLG